MGQDESKPNQPNPQQIQQVNPEHKASFPLPKWLTEEYDGIPPLEPLVLGQGQFPNDFALRTGTLPDSHKMVVDYLHKISSRINNNEKQIAMCIKKQLEEYIALPDKLAQKQDELNSRLSRILTLFRQLDDEVKSTTDALKSTIKFADQLAAQIDPNFPNFADFRKQ